jgi:hypothetical protein
MPAASLSPGRTRRSSAGGRPRTRSSGPATGVEAVVLAGSRVRWDRVGRLAMLCVLVAIVCLYASTGLRMLSTWHQARHDDAMVARMAREHTQLLRERQQLSTGGTLEAQARQLGMMRPGEQPYVITGLPDN